MFLIQVLTYWPLKRENDQARTSIRIPLLSKFTSLYEDCEPHQCRNWFNLIRIICAPD